MRQRAFSLIELLVVIAVIALLISILLPALAAARQEARKIVEMAACQQLLVGYHTYSSDSKGLLMPGLAAWYEVYHDDNEFETDRLGAPVGLAHVPMPVYDDQNQRLHYAIAQPYVWRIAPYVSDILNSLVKDRELAARIRPLRRDPMGWGTQTYQYALACNPTFGMNSTRTNIEQKGRGGYGVAQRAKRSGDITLSTKYIVFAGARDGFAGSPRPVVPGSYRVKGPYDVTRYADSDSAFDRVIEYPYASPKVVWDPARHPRDFGFVDYRYAGKTVTGHFDGHVQMSTLDMLRDMRMWSHIPQDWNLPKK